MNRRDRVVETLRLRQTSSLRVAEGAAEHEPDEGRHNPRQNDGGRIGWGKAGWAMMIRTLLAPFLLFMIFEPGANGFRPVRISIDDRATRKLRTAGFQRLS